jgi:hypothetical protein
MANKNSLFEPLGKMVTIVGLAVPGISAIWFAMAQLAEPKSPHLISGVDRIQTALILGVVGMAAYGILWSAACKIFGWSYGEGSRSELPQGWEAVVLSLCTTIPLTILPAAYEFFTRKRLVLDTHYRASLLMIFAAAIAHLLLYGTRSPRIKGLRDRIFPQQSSLDAGRAFRMELIYTVVHFVSTVTVYQLALDPTISLSNFWWITVKTFISGVLFFTGACSYIAIRYPSSLGPVPVTLRDGSVVMDDQWAAARGVVNGAILMMALMIGILL